MKTTVRNISLEGRKVKKVWGNFLDLYREQTYLVKRLLVKPGKRLSLQSHNCRSEVWVVVQGTAVVEHGKRERTMRPGEMIFIPVQECHRIENIGDNYLIIIEVQLGTSIDEEDIIRYEDDYGREGSVEM